MPIGISIAQRSQRPQRGDLGVGRKFHSEHRGFPAWNQSRHEESYRRTFREAPNPEASVALRGFRPPEIPHRDLRAMYLSAGSRT
jgi:hypothetical protein